jgi:two-component system, chemotaxis family, chemotaxis protein CheY
MSGHARIWGAGGAHLTPTDREQSALPAPRILVIDSDSLHRMIICRAADKAGYVPAGAANPAEATKLLQSTAFDCIVLDLSLGREATSGLLSRLGAIGCKAKILAMGDCDAPACHNTQRLAKSLALDVGEPVAKPVDVGRLRYVLEQLRVQGALQRGLGTVGA